MSLFKKPNRNIRRREVDVSDDDVENNEHAHTVTSNKSAQKNGTTPSKQSLLSFGQDFDEGDDGEVFQVRKTAISKKIRRNFDKQREGKKKKEVPLPDIEISKNEDKPKVADEDQLTITFKNPIQGIKDTESEKILTGLSAEMADYESDSENEDDECSTFVHRYAQPDQVKILLKSGQIPDATVIHEARKRRQQAREMGTMDFIPVPNTSVTNETNTRNNREEEIDESEDEERITMSGIVSATADIEKRRQGFDRVILSEPEDGDRDEDDDDDHWEEQQIRKGVTGAQLAAAQQESLYSQYSNNNTGIVSESIITCGSLFPPLSVAESSNKLIDPEEISVKLKSRFKSLKETYNKHKGQRDATVEEISSLRVEFDKCKLQVDDLVERLQFYQDLRGYVTDLVECLDEKIPLICALEQRVISVYEKQTSELLERRRQDVKDQLEEVMAPSKIAGKRDENLIRRSVEREGRKTRRSKNRPLMEAVNHVDGMSTDDELTETEIAVYRTQTETIDGNASGVFEDVVEEFSSLDHVLGRFSEWRAHDIDAYTEAYAHICLAKLLGPFIRMEIMMWNPLKEMTILDGMKWVCSVSKYCADNGQMEESLHRHPDIYLLPRLLEKIILPKVEQIVKIHWDPLSRKQSKLLCCLVKNVVQYPRIGANSKTLKQLINTVISKINECLENDIFIPMFPKQMLQSEKLNTFFQRQFNVTLKLLGNILLWHGLIKDDILVEMTLNCLLNRYLLVAIRSLTPTESLTKCYMVAKHIPMQWMACSTTMMQLTQFMDYTRHLISKQHQQLQLTTEPQFRDALDRLQRLIKQFH